MNQEKLGHERLAGCLFAVVALAFANSCATSPPVSDSSGSSGPGKEFTLTPPKPKPPKKAETVEFHSIQTLYNGRAYEAALTKTAFFESKYPSSSYLPQVHNLHGLILLLTKHSSESITEFNQALKTGELAGGTDVSSSWRQYVLYNLGAAQFDAGQPEDAQHTLSEIRLDALDKDTQIKTHFLSARVYQKRTLDPEAAAELLKASRILENQETKGMFASLLDASLKNVANVETLEKLYKDYEDAPLADLVLIRLAQQERTDGKSAASEAHARALMSQFPNSTHYAEATDIVRSTTQTPSNAAVDDSAVGVLLPLSGKFAKFGQRAVQGIELAFRIFNTKEPSSKVRLILMDSGEEPETALKALNSLYYDHHVVAVLGPLLSKGIDVVSARAQELGVPLISLAQQPGAGGEYVFQSAITPKIQADEIARYAVQTLGLHKFAIVYPKDKFGEEYSQDFWNAVDSLGGKVVGIEAYNPTETDFRHVVDKLSGLYFTEFRQRELEALAKARDENHIKKRTRKTEQYFSLKPIVDYEAVFVPDEPKVAGQVLPTFAYRDVDKVKFLGTSAWNSLDLVTRAQKYAEGATFVDGYYAQSSSPTVQKFIDRYKATFNQEPTAIDAVVYDAASLLENVLIASSSLTRVEVKERLRDIKNFPGVTGKISFKEGQFTRTLKVLTIHDGQIAEVR